MLDRCWSSFISGACSETEPVASVYRWCHADGAEKTQRLGVDRAFHIQKDPGFQALIGWCWVSSRVQHYPTLQCILVLLSYQMPEWSCMAWPAWMERERERVFLWNLQETQAPTEEFSFFPAISTHDFQVPSVKRLHSTQNFKCPRGTCGSSSAPRERSCHTRLKGPTVSCDILRWLVNKADDHGKGLQNGLFLPYHGIFASGQSGPWLKPAFLISNTRCGTPGASEPL